MQGKNCPECGRGPRIGTNRSHSMRATKKIVYLNLQKVDGRLVCTRCQRTLLKKRAVAA